MTESLSRRGFMQLSAAAAGAVALGTAARSQAGTMSGKIKKAVKYGMIDLKGSDLEKLTLLKELGYDGVEPGVDEVADPDEFLAASKETGIEIHGIVQGWSVENLDHAVDRAKFFGASTILVVPRKVDESMPYEQNYIETHAKIAEALPYAKENGVMFLIENVWNNFLLSPLEMARYIDEFESDNIGVYFDIGNIVRVGWPEHWIRTLGSRIKKLDVKEYSRDKQKNEGLWKGFDVKIGEGSVDWKEVCTALNEIGYTGWGTAEVRGGGRERLADISERMDRVFDL